MATKSRKANRSRNRARRSKTIKETTMIDKETLTVDLQAVCDKHQIHLVGTATPISPDDIKFDIAASPA